MKTKSILLLSAVLAAGLVSCTKGDQPQLDEMTFDPGFGRTKVTATSFENGDRIGVYVTGYDGQSPRPLEIGGNYANNALVTFNGTAWSAEPKIYWEEGLCDVYAYYPYANPASIEEMKFSVQDDQDAEGGYAESDFLWTKKTGLSRMESVPLVFGHKMSRLDIRLVKGLDYTGDLPEDASVIIHNTVREAVVDLSSGVVVKNPHAAATDIKALQRETGNYSAIIVPQRLENKLPLIEILVGEVSYLVESRFVFKAGVCHTFSVTLNDDPGKVVITIGGEISDWD